LKAPDEKFPAEAIRTAGYGAVWHGQKAWNGVAILQRAGEPALIRRGLPGDPDDTHSRYIEAEVNGLIVGCRYLPNGSPAPGPKFDYELRSFERLQEYAGGLLASGAPVVLAGDYNVMSTELDDCAQDHDRCRDWAARAAHACGVAGGFRDFADNRGCSSKRAGKGMIVPSERKEFMDLVPPLGPKPRRR
jgi:exodeoxyribonuclease-3